MILSENSHFSRGITVTIVEETELVKLAPNTSKTNQSIQWYNKSSTRSYANMKHQLTTWTSTEALTNE